MIVPRCSECLHGYQGAQGTYCVAFALFVSDEVAAAIDCPCWEVW